MSLHLPPVPPALRIVAANAIVVGSVLALDGSVTPLFWAAAVEAAALYVAGAVAGVAMERRPGQRIWAAALAVAMAALTALILTVFLAPIALSLHHQEDPAATWADALADLRLALPLGLLAAGIEAWGRLRKGGWEELQAGTILRILLLVVVTGLGALYAAIVAHPLAPLAFLALGKTGLDLAALHFGPELRAWAKDHR